MTLNKGQKLRCEKRLYHPNGELYDETINTYEVVRLNPKTYGLKCVDGSYTGMGCKIRMDCALRQEYKSLGWLTVIDYTPIPSETHSENAYSLAVTSARKAKQTRYNIKCKVHKTFTEKELNKMKSRKECGADILMKQQTRKVIAIDFDGCLCTNAWPKVGAPCWETIKKALIEQANGAALILWTCREGELLSDAVSAAADWGLYFNAVNESLPEWIEQWGSDPRKIGATEYWDDKAIRMEATQNA